MINRKIKSSFALSLFSFLDPRLLSTDETNKKNRKGEKPNSLPSVFSLIVTRLTSSYRVLYPGIEKHGRTLAYSCSSLRSVRLSDLCPFPIGVAIGPFRPIPCFRTESRFSRVTILLVRGSTVVPMCCSSQETGTPAASKTALTASAISGPIPEVLSFFICRFEGHFRSAGAVWEGEMIGCGGEFLLNSSRPRFAAVERAAIDLKKEVEEVEEWRRWKRLKKTKKRTSRAPSLPSLGLRSLLDIASDLMPSSQLSPLFLSPLCLFSSFPLGP